MSEIVGKPIRQWDGTAMQYGVVSSSRRDEKGTLVLKVDWMQGDNTQLASTPSECPEDSVEFFDIEGLMRDLNALATECNPPTSFLHALRKDRSNKYRL